MNHLHLLLRRQLATLAGKQDSIPWYLPTGVSAANVLAAYHPKGAASLAASYVNKANPGTYNLSPGNAPILDAYGWDSTSGTPYLNIGNGGYTLSGAWTIIARLKCGTIGSSRSYIGGLVDLAVACGVLATGVPRAFSNTSGNIINGTTALTAGVDVTLVFTDDGAGSGKVYLNGVDDTTGSVNRTVSAATGKVMAAQGASNWTGNIALLAVLNVKIDATQALELHTKMAAE